MKIKKIIIAATTFAIVFSTCIGIKSLADNYWTGHGEIQTINNNIDTLSNRVKSKMTLSQVFRVTNVEF